MKQSIAGVSPASLDEVTVMTVWPSVAATRWGRFWGRLCGCQFGFRLFGVPVTVGQLWAVVSIPFILPLYFHMLAPRIPFFVLGVVNKSCRRYRITNRRVIVEHGLGGGPQRWVPLDRFDQIEVDVLPGQEWFPAGDLVFRLGQVETLRLSGVPRPETFRQACLKAHTSHIGVHAALATAAG